MKMKTTLILSIFGLSTAITGCAVIPEEPEIIIEEPVAIVVPPVEPLCYEIAELQKVEVPAETKTVYAVSVIENPPYEPIEQRTEQRIVIKQAEVFYVKVDPETGNQAEVTTFCDENVEVGPVGPAEGELEGPPVPVQ